MMNLTNKHNLEDMIVRVLSHDNYDYNSEVISATQLMSPPLMYALKKVHPEKLERDVADNCASVFGSAVHALIEEVDLGFECEKEIRLFRKIEVDGKEYTISGKFDILKKMPAGINNYQLIDTKTTSVWTRIYNSREQDYINQLSTYRWLGYGKCIVTGKQIGRAHV